MEFYEYKIFTNKFCNHFFSLSMSLIYKHTQKYKIFCVYKNLKMRYCYDYKSESALLKKI